VPSHLGVKKGDRVTLYLPMIPEAAVAMLACARIGAVHSVVFGGFRPSRSPDASPTAVRKVVITADEGLRGGKQRAAQGERGRSAGATAPSASKPCWWCHTQRRGGRCRCRAIAGIHAVVEGQPATCEPERMNAEDPLFILYTSGSTGKPKGVLHTTGGYLRSGPSYTHECVFDLREDDVLLVHRRRGLGDRPQLHVLYGPLANGATSLMFEGVPHPDTSRFWEVCDKHQVTIFYTAPTAIRALMREGEAPVKKARPRDSLRLLGTVGEPINPEAWEWYHRVVGEGRCPVVDTWWQTETGGILISPLPVRSTAEAGFRHPALLRRRTRHRRCQRRRARRRLPRATWCCSIPGRGRCARSTAITSASSTPISRTYPGTYFTGDGCGAMPMATTGSPVASTT
jgi:acetyl-CoA synthetase